MTGSTSGIGLATAVQLANVGPSRIVINGRNKERGESARRIMSAQAPHTEICFVAADVSTIAGAKRLIQQGSDFLGGPIDVLVNSAGGEFGPKLFHDLSLEESDGIIAHWLMATIYCCSLAYPLMADGGAIVNVASDAAKVATPGEAVPGAAMAGISMFTRTLAMEAKRRRIRVNAVTPSLVSNTLTYSRITAEGFSAKLFAKASAAAHLGVPEPEDVASVIAFLASKQAARLTGQIISVNGGISAGIG